MTMDATIRNARHTDVASLVELLNQLFSIEVDFVVDERRQRRGISMMMDGCGKHRCVKVADVGGRVVGLATVQLLISTVEGAFSAWIEDLVVTESLRGHGIGKALLAAVEIWARQHGATRLQLLADKQNHRALDFYGKHRWTPTQLICLRKAAESDST